ncbi:hypothetical protein, partial [Enterococcus faecium]
MTTFASGQTYDAFGETIAQADNDGFITRYTYDALGDQVAKISPSVAVVDETGLVTQINPTTLTYYDVSGRQV